MAMMNWMRRSSRYFLAAVVITFVASLAYFGATQDRGAQEWVASVNGEQIAAGTYQQAYRAAVEQYRQILRDRFTDELVRSLRLQDQVIDRLVTERLMRQRADAEGLHVSDEELSEQITRIGAFQEGGRFSRERYLRVLSQAQLTAPIFEEEFRGELLRQKLQGLITDGVRVSEAELRQQWELERQRVRAAFVLVTQDPALDGIAVTDAELEAHYKAHPGEFTQPERRRILAALLPGSSVPVPAVTDAELEAAYKARRAEFEQPTRARVAHILVRVGTVGGSTAEDAAKAKAEAALQRVRAGTDFAQVAREVSEDAATASKGGDLGLVGPGELVPELDRVVFGLKRGDMAGPVRTPFGYHVVKVVEMVPGAKKELREVATTLRATLAAEGQLRALREKAQEIQQALLAATDFATEARRRGLTVREIGPLGRSDAVEGIGRVSEASEAIFALPPDGVSGPVKVPEGYAIFRLVERQTSRLQPLAEVRGDATRAVRRQKAQEAAQVKARQLAEALRAGEDPRAVAKQQGGTFGEVGPFSRAAPLADKDLGQAIGPLALTLPAGGVGGPVPGPGGYYVVKVLGRERPDPAEFDAIRTDVEARLLRDKRTRIWQAWLASLRGAAKIEINRKVLPDT